MILSLTEQITTYALLAEVHRPISEYTVFLSPSLTRLLWKLFEFLPKKFWSGNSSLKPTTYSLQPTIYNLQPTAYSLQPTAYILQPTTYSLQPTTYSLQPTAYNLQPTAYSLQPTAYRLQQDFKHDKMNDVL